MSLKIPLHLKTIGENVFTYCKQLRKVEIHENSELQRIDKYAFSLSHALIQLLFCGAKILQIIEIDEISNIEETFSQNKQTIIIIKRKH